MLAISRPTELGRPPGDFTEMLDTAAQLLPEGIMAAVRDAGPVGEISVSRNTAAVWRRYDRMSRLPSGLVILGDALCSLNPLYGQGMTMAALQALALRDCLRADDVDVSRRFFLAAAERIGPVWSANRTNDRPPSADDGRWRLTAWTWPSGLNFSPAARHSRPQHGGGNWFRKLARPQRHRVSFHGW